MMTADMIETINVLIVDDEALARDRFQEAQSEYRKATELDPSHQRAARSLASRFKTP